MSRLPKRKGGILLLLVAVGIILCSTYLRYSIIRDTGLSITPDSVVYLRSSTNLSQGNSIFPVYDYYDPVQDVVVKDPVTHYPPLAAIIYSIPMSLGIAPHTAPTVISLLFWALFLAGIGLLAYRLSQSPTTAVFAIALAAISFPFLWTFNFVWSEPIFLLFLIYTALVFSCLPQQQSHRTLSMIVGSLLLGILMLTRYVGMFFYAATVVWWLGWRFRHKSPLLLRDMFIMFSAALPFLGWIVRNIIVSGNIFGVLGHIEGHAHISKTYTHDSFSAGVEAVFGLIPWFLLPLANPIALLNSVGLHINHVYVFLLVLMIGWGIVLWRQHRTTPKALQQGARFLMSTPIPLWLLTYFAVYTLAQPFFAFAPMDMRDLTTALCLFQPWILALLSRVSRHGVWTLFLCCIIIIIFGWKTSYDIPIYPEPGYPRTRDLITRHPETIAFIQSFDAPGVIVTDVEYLFAPYPRLGVVSPPLNSFARWLHEGTCNLERSGIIVLFHGEWEETRGNSEEPRSRQYLVEQKCPDLKSAAFSDSLVYYHLSAEDP